MQDRRHVAPTGEPACRTKSCRIRQLTLVEDMMTVVRLQRHAPEAHNARICAVCGTTEPGRVTDHIQVGPPGTPTYDEGVCELCGRVLDTVVDRYGSSLNVTVEEAKHEASDADVAVRRSE